MESSVGLRCNSGSMGQFAAIAVLDDVMATTTAAVHFVCFTQTISTNTHPSTLNCGNPHHERVVWNIACDHGTGGHKAILTQYHTADDRCIRPNGGASSYQGSFVLVLPFDMTAWIDHIREDHGRSAEDIVLKLHPGIHRDIILNLYAVADPDTRADNDVLTEIAVTSDP
jgi:hypothetical protein